jgi:hypothetical protein
MRSIKSSNPRKGHPRQAKVLQLVANPPGKADLVGKLVTDIVRANTPVRAEREALHRGLRRVSLLTREALDQLPKEPAALSYVGDLLDEAWHRLERIKEGLR